MDKLTQKEYIERLPDTNFIACCHNTTSEAILEHIATHKTELLPTIYKVDRVQLRSKDMIMHYSDKAGDTPKGKSHRQFAGKNSYYSHDGLLIHENVQEGHSAIFLNK